CALPISHVPYRVHRSQRAGRKPPQDRHAHYQRLCNFGGQCEFSQRRFYLVLDTILKNRVYVGDMVQGRQRVKSYKIHIQERVPVEEWFIVENTHEAIIDREIFDKVQGLLKRDTRTAPKAKQLYLFSGFLKCADCGRAMSRIASKGIYVYYQCGTYKSLSKKACTMHSIKSDRLEAGVLFAIQQQVHLAVAYSELVSR